jgi:hypothetical protein
MRRLTAVAAFGLLLAVPLWAQRGGGHAGGFGGARGGFGGGHAGFAGHAGISGGHMGGGHFSGGHLSGRAGFSRGFAHSSRTSFSRFPRFHDNIRERLHFRNCFGWNCRGFGTYPFWGWGYYDPFLWNWWDHNSNDDQDYEGDRTYVEQLSAENAELRQMLRQEQEDRDEDAYSRPSNPRPRPNAENKQDEQSSQMPPTVLVFRDQHKQEVNNYAIVGQMLWAFVPQHKQKIPLADLDIPATIRANDDRGVIFRVPGAAPAS